MFLHGNAQNISTHTRSVAWLTEEGYNVFAYDYRGYGKSGGVPDYALARSDLREVVQAVSQFPETAGKPLFVFGQSLGGAIAISSLSRAPERRLLAGIVTEGAPASLRQAAREILSRPWLTWSLQYPLSWLISDAYAPQEEIAKIAPTPLMIVHSRDDAVVPYHHGAQLHQAAPAGHVWLPATGPHIGAFALPEARAALLNFLATPPPTRTTRAPSATPLPRALDAAPAHTAPAQ